MDDNKEFLGSDNETDSIVNSDTDTVDNVNLDSEATDTVSDNGQDLGTFDNLDSSLNSVAVTDVKTKKKVLQLPIIIAIVIVALAAIGFLVFKCFFNTSPVGTWVVDTTSTADEATTATQDETSLSYYTFTDKGEANISIGTMKMVGTYTLEQKDSKNSITINIPNVLTGSFEYKVSGNCFAGRHLELSTGEENSKPVNMKSATVKSPELKTDSKFKENTKLTGKWKDLSSYNGDNSYNINYEFKSDGKVSINESDQLYVEGTYVIDKNTITVTYYASSKLTMNLSYSFDGKTLVINGMGFTKDDGSTKDQAKK